MHVIENLKKDILGFFLATERLHIIHDQNIDQLVEMHKVILGVVANGINELLRKTLS